MRMMLMTTKRDRVMRRLLMLRLRETKKMKRQRMKVRIWFAGTPLPYIGPCHFESCSSLTLVL